MITGWGFHRPPPLGWPGELGYPGRKGAEMKTRIWTLAEDTVLKPNLIAEHGLAFFLATADGDILFDTGQGFAAVRNAAVMGIDLKRASAIVLSHGHYDHTGGLASVLAATGPGTVRSKLIRR